MNVALVGNDTLDWKIDDLHKLVKNYVYPHKVTAILTTNEDGTAASARMMANTYNITCVTCKDRYEAIDCCDMAVVLRKDTDYPVEIRYATRKGKLNKEYVLVTK